MGDRGACEEGDGAMKCYGEQLRIAREARGISRDDLAGGLGVSPRQVKHWENASDAFELELTDRRIGIIRRLNFPLAFYQRTPEHLIPRSVAFFCGPGAAKAARESKCAVERCSGVSEYLCDFHVTESRTCDRQLCDRHAIEFGTDDDPIDYCPAHASIVAEQKAGTQ